MPYLWGHYRLETQNCHLRNDCNNGPSKVINDFSIFLGINITVINCQSTHTFIGDAAPDHQTCTNTATWIQAWWSSFFAGSSPNMYTVVHSQIYLTFITIYHLLPEIIYSCMPIQFTPCQPFSEIVVANSDAFCLQHTCDILCQTSFFEQFNQIQVEPYTH